LKDPKRFAKLGVKPPRGLLFLGPPGTGKTMLAKAIAGEAGVKFFSKAGSDFVEMFVGVGASRVRDFFKLARENAPCIMFIDELDALGKARGGAGGGNNGQEAEQTLNQLLIELDGFDTSLGIILIGATNRPDVLDKGLTRPGRFDRHITLDLPDLKAREAVFAVHLKNKPCDPDVNIKSLAQGTPGQSPADIANICNEGGLLAGLAGKESINMKDFENAKDKILMGDERTSLVMIEEEKRKIAAHEAGHVIVGELSPQHDPVYKVSIIPRARSLGVTMFLPLRDEIGYSKTKVESKISGLYGGRVVEELVFGADEITTGAQNDIERATGLARGMVTEWGLSRLGPIAFKEEGGGAQFLGGRGSFQRHTSEATAQAIDDEVKRILDEGYVRATKIIQANRKPLDVMTNALLKWETLGVVQINEILKEGKELHEVTPPPGFGEPVVVSETKEEISTVEEKETTPVGLTKPEGKE
jgi:cell division protease FtsH